MTPKVRAAKAVLKALDTATKLDCTDEKHVGQAVANAVLAAIAEPSEAMIDAMKNSCWNSLTDDYVRKVWRAAHAAMMAEKG